MDVEAAVTTEMFGSALKGTVLAGCVNPAHLYGLTFAVWLPMTLGIPLFGERLSSQEEFLRVPEPVSAVTTPTFLRYLDDALDAVRAHFVLSAGGKLEPEAVTKARRFFGCPISEIYGSTEAGVVGVRRHEQESIEPSWHFCPGISLLSENDTGTVIRTPPHTIGRLYLRGPPGLRKRRLLYAPRTARLHHQNRRGAH